MGSKRAYAPRAPRRQQRVRGEPAADTDEPRVGIYSLPEGPDATERLGRGGMKEAGQVDRDRYREGDERDRVPAAAITEDGPRVVKIRHVEPGATHDPVISNHDPRDGPKQRAIAG